MTREELISQLEEAGFAGAGPYVDDALEAHQILVDSGKEPWPVAAYVLMEEQRNAGRSGDTERFNELDRQIWKLTSTKPYPGLTDEERAAARAAVRRHAARRDKRKAR